MRYFKHNLSVQDLPAVFRSGQIQMEGGNYFYCCLKVNWRLQNLDSFNEIASVPCDHVTIASVGRNTKNKLLSLTLRYLTPLIPLLYSFRFVYRSYYNFRT